MITRHPGRAIGVVVAVGAVCFVLAGLIGQHNDGPWGGLPSWLGGLGWFGFLLSVLALLLLLAYLGVSKLRSRGPQTS